MSRGGHIQRKEHCWGTDAAGARPTRLSFRVSWEGDTGCLSLAKILFSLLSHLSQGTVIRVFSIPEGQKLFEFRRGVKR